MYTFRNNHRFNRRSRRLLAALAGGLLLCLAGSAADRQHNCPKISNGTLTIPNGCTYTITGSESYTDVEVRNGGILNLASGAILKVSDTLSVASNGLFRFNDQTEGTPPILRAAYHTLKITGNIQTTSGADEGGVIDTDTASDSVRLVSGEISCQYGPVEIRAADFENDGTVTANGGFAGYDITLTSACVINNASVGLWQVTAANSDMIFDHDDSTVPSLSGDSDFNVEAGRMYFMESLSTAGGYRQIGGTCEAAAGATFTAAGAY